MKRAFLFLALSLVACGRESDDKSEGPSVLPTTALPLDSFATSNFSLVTADEACAAVDSFFQIYTKQNLPGITTVTECAQYTKTEFGPDVGDVGNTLTCRDDQICFKAFVKMTKGEETEIYTAFLFKRNDNKSSGILGSLDPKNKHLLPLSGDKVVEGQLFHDGLSQIVSTFRAWAFNAN